MSSGISMEGVADSLISRAGNLTETINKRIEAFGAPDSRTKSVLTREIKKSIQALENDATTFFSEIKETSPSLEEKMNDLRRKVTVLDESQRRASAVVQNAARVILPPQQESDDDISARGKKRSREEEGQVQPPADQAPSAPQEAPPEKRRRIDSRPVEIGAGATTALFSVVPALITAAQLGLSKGAAYAATASVVSVPIVAATAYAGRLFMQSGRGERIAMTAGAITLGAVALMGGVALGPSIGAAAIGSVVGRKIQKDGPTAAKNAEALGRTASEEGLRRIRGLFSQKRPKSPPSSPPNKS